MSLSYPKPTRISQDEARALINQSYTNYRKSIEKLQKQAQWDIESIWSDTFSFSDPQERIDETHRIIQNYGDRAAQAAQNYYMQVRVATSAAFDIELPPYTTPQYPSREQLIWNLSGGTNNTDYPGLHLKDVIPDSHGIVHNKMGIRIDDLWPSTDNIDDYLKYISKWIQSAGRMQIMANISHDPTQPRWARVPKGPTCEFCLMLASRGFDYHSQETASLGGSFHNGACDCVIVPSWMEQKITGYNPELLKQRWQACADTAARLTTREKYEKYVETFTPDLKHKKPYSYSHWKRNIELSEARWRDKIWLNGGPAPAIIFPNDKIRNETIQARPQELRTAQRLRKHGVSPTFQVDSKPIINPETGIEERVGLSDWAGGIEIKTPDKAKSFRSIDSYLGSAGKKEDCRRLIIDNTENPNMSDDQLIAYIMQSNRFKRGLIYILNKQEDLIRIK